MNNQYCLITGATGGLGRAFSFEAAKRGYNLLLVDLDEENLLSLKAGINNNYSVTVNIFSASITINDDILQVWDYLDDNKIKLDVLINVAGGDQEGLIASTDPSVQTWIAELNAVGTLRMLLNGVKYKSDTLRIINIASMAGFYPMPLKAVYSASKRFLIDLGYSLNDELNPQNIYITTVCPAGLPTRRDIIQKIDSQGLIGTLTTINIGKVAEKSFDKAIKKKKIYIPGVINQITVFVTMFIPKGVLTKMIGRRWRKTNNVETTIKIRETVPERSHV